MEDFGGQAGNSSTATFTEPAGSVRMWLSISERLSKPYLMQETKECEGEGVMSHQDDWKIGLTI